MPPRAGGLSLVLRSGETAATVPFGVTPVPDLPPGHGQFCFTVPAAGEVSSAEVRAAGARALRLPSRSLAVRTGALAAAVRSGTLVAREARSLLHLEWDAGVHPYVNVLHEGVRRTALALHLTGGSADVSLAGLPPGGSFVIHYSDGLNPVERTLPRSVGPEDQ